MKRLCPHPAWACLAVVALLTGRAWAAGPSLPGQTNRTVLELSALTVTNTATDTNTLGQLATNSIFFTYANRGALLADGWSFIATNGNGSARQTEITNASDTAIVSYDQTAHPGAIWIPCDLGDMWGTANNTTNSLFRAAPTNWVSVQLDLSFTPTQDFQQVHLGLYQNDDNYAQVGYSYNSSSGGRKATFNLELAASPTAAGVTISGITNSHIRLDRNPASGLITGYYSLDGTNWTSTGSGTQSFTSPRIGIWVGGNQGHYTAGDPIAILRRLDIITSNTVPVSLAYALVNSPTNAAISTNGIISWTPTEAQGPGTNLITTIATDNHLPPLSATNSFSVVVQEVNLPPILPPQTNRTIVGSAALIFTNTASDPDIPANSLTYALQTGPTNAAIDANGVITWTPVSAQIPSTNLFTTVVTDFNSAAVNSQHLSATNSFTVFVTGTHNGPSLPVQTNRTIAELTQLVVTNTASDSDIPQLALTYSLLAPAPANATISNSGIITWTPSQAQSPSTNVIVTVVTDSGTPPLSATNLFTVVVREVNQAPVLGLLATQTINELTLLTVTNAATEPNIHSTTVGYGLIAAPAGASISPAGVVTWMPTQAQSPSTNVITTVVTNSNPFDAVNPRLTATNSFTVVVREVNQAPVLSGIPAQSVDELSLLTVTNAATEPNIHSVTIGYGLLTAPEGASVSAAGVITWVPAQTQSPSTNLIVVAATNSNPFDVLNPQLTATNSFMVVVREVNQPPVLPVIGTQIVKTSNLLTVTNSATEPNIHSVTVGYGLLNAPVGASISSAGIITWTPTPAQGQTTNTFTTVATNSNPYDLVNPQLTATNSFLVIVPEQNQAPVLPVIATQTVNELTLLIVSNTASEPDPRSVTIGYTLINPPAGASINANGIITWTPAQTQSPSTNVITTVVTNNDPFDPLNPQLTATNSFTVLVREVNQAPVLGTVPTQTISELSLLILTNAASEPNIHSVTVGYGLLNPPAGVSIDGNGVITWTPGQTQSPSTNLITTVATNNNPYDLVNPSLTATNTFSVVVREANQAPVLAAIGDQTVNELTLFAITNSASEPNIHSVTLGYGLINPPAGAAIDANGVISWTPAQTQSPGTNLITTVVTNSNPYDLVNPRLTATNSFRVVVREVNQPPVLPAIGTQTVNELTLLTVTNAATEPNIHSVTFRYGLIDAPAGAVIDNNGVITWTPAQTQSPSTNFFTTVVTNNNPYDLVNRRLRATNSFTVVVREVNQPPVLPLLGPQTVVEGTLLTVTNAATEPNIHSVTVGYGLINPPAGMSITGDGVITWTPTHAQSPGTNLIATVATNSNPYDLGNPQLTVTNSFTVLVLVRETNIPPLLPNLPNQTVNELTLLSVTNTASEPNPDSVTVGYALLNPPVGASVSSNGVITWTPAQTQSPSTNVLTTVVTNLNLHDPVNSLLSATNSFTVVVREVNQPPVLPLIPLQSVLLQSPLAVTNTAGEPNIHSVTVGYGLLSAPSGMAINSSGVINWTPSLAQVPSTNLVTTVVTNNNPYDLLNPRLTATNTFSVVVGLPETNVAPVLPVIANRTVNELTLLTVTNTATEFSPHSVTLGYGLVNAPAGVAVGTNGILTWTPAQTQSPETNVLTTVVTNYNPFDALRPRLTATNSFTVVVREVNQPPVLPVIGPKSVSQQALLLVTNTASEPNLHSLTVSYSLLNAPVGANISADGIITWIPTPDQSPSTNVITTVVANSNRFDTVSHQLMASNSFTVVVYSVSAGTPVEQGTLNLQSSVLDVQASDQRLYIAAGVNGLVIEDTTAPAFPQLLTTFDTPGVAYGIREIGPMAFLATGPAGLEIIDVDQAGQSAVISNANGMAYGLDVAEGMLYLADGSNGLQLIDVSTPLAPVPRGGYVPPGIAYGVQTAGGVAYVACGPGGLQVLSVTNPASVVPVGAYAAATDVLGVKLLGATAYLAAGNAGLLVLDVSNPANPHLLGSYPTKGRLMAIEVAQTFAVLAEGTNGVEVVNVANPASITSLGTDNAATNAVGLSLYGTMVYVAAAENGLKILDLAGLSLPGPAIQTNTPGITVAVGQNLTLQVGATGIGPLTYQWFKDNIPLFPGPTVSGAASASLSLSNLTLDASGVYTAVVRDGWNVGVAAQTVVTVVSVGTPVALSAVPDPQDILGVLVSGQTALVASRLGGLKVFDCHDPLNPVQIGGHTTSGMAQQLRLVGNLAYLAAWDGGLDIFDVFDPTNVAFIGHADTPGLARDVDVVGSIAYVADSQAGLRVFDVSNPTRPLALGGAATSGFALGVKVVGTLAYVAAGQGLDVFDVSDPLAVTRLGSLPTPGTAEKLDVIGSLVYLACTDQGLQLIDVSDPTAPQLVGSIQTLGDAFQVQVNGGLAYIAEGAGKVAVVDVSNPSLPILSLTGLAGVSVHGLHVRGNLAFLADRGTGLVLSQLFALPPLAPAIVQQPLALSAATGATITVSVDVDGTPPLTFRWSKDGAGLTNSAQIQGVNGASLRLEALAQASAGNYTLWISNSAGTVTSTNISLTVSSPGSPPVPPSVLVQPGDQTVQQGAIVDLVASVAGSAPLELRWYQNGQALLNDEFISGADSAHLRIYNVQRQHAGLYQLWAWNAAGLTNSRVATLTYVGPVQSQIDLAAPGAVVSLADGTYQETLTVSKDLILVGSDPTTTVLNGLGLGTVLHVMQGANVLVQGLTILNGNATNDVGGGIKNEGHLTLYNCVLANSTAGSGGGLANLNSAIVQYCTITTNAATAQGGGIFNDLQATLALVDSTVSSNCGADGGGLFSDGNLWVTNCTVSRNLANGVFGTPGGNGGGLRLSGQAWLVNSTVSGNQALANLLSPGGGTGGGLRVDAGTTQVRNATVAFNSATGTGGGLQVAGGAVASLRNTIAGDNQAGGTGADLCGTVTSLGYNLVENPGCGVLLGNTNGNLLGLDPLLGSLQDNGGPTWTHLLLSASPAIDAGACDYSTDQRGVPRPFDAGWAPNVAGGCDIGAFELINNLPYLFIRSLPAGGISLSWQGPGTLQGAPDPSGPWQDIGGANPLFVPQPGPAVQFYRIRATNSPPVLSQSPLVGGQFTLSWSGVADLKAAPTPDGPWRSLGAVTPLTIIATPYSTQFFRLKVLNQ